ncbi:receptor protein-tyrosine kinase [Elysia marginata]|uniref:Receptor protein-tyrosine kinase n=1 Tax=Elysia marginata TaxID=1093978 RepID=A0AAV4H6H0_9GAST|nr:receptor protein-tyrosine kinase [Elysia marginata]
MTEGDGVLTCDSAGKWIGQLPTCDLNCGRAPLSPGTVWSADITNQALVTLTADTGLEVAEAYYRCKSQLSDTDLYQDNKVVCDRVNGQWKNPANIFCKNESYLPYDSWVPRSSLLEETSTSLMGLTSSNETSSAEYALIDYLTRECYEMLNTDAFAELLLPFLPRGRDYELTSVELRLQTVHSNDECVEKSSHWFGINYVGTTNVTTSNLTCQAWAETSPHNHQFTTENLFPDASLSDVKNYCRNPYNKGTYEEKPWCYTIDPGVEWDYCDIPGCHKYKVQVTVENATDGGTDQMCGESEFYTSDILKNWTISCPQAPTGPFGTELKITANASQPLFLCELKPNGVDTISGCGEPPHRRGWELVSLDGHSLGDRANYTCARGFYYKRGSKMAKCTRSRLWSGPFLECSDETNLALDDTPLRDNNFETCTTISVGSSRDIWLSNMMEVSEVVLTLEGRQGPTSSSANAPDLHAIIHDGTSRRLYKDDTDEGYLFKSPFQPITNQLKISVTSDLNICEIAVFGRNSSQTLECTMQISGGADYKGNLSVTEDGHQCIPWTEHNRITDFEFGDGNSSYVQNFCRNPFDKRDGGFYSGSKPICFYRDHMGDIQKDYCEVLFCDAGCRNDQAGVSYQGELHHIGTDLMTSCEQWNTGDHRFVRKVDFAGETTNHNGCRNPGRSQERAWCITSSSDLPVSYSYCNIPECPKSAEIQWVINVDLNNQTQIDEFYSLHSKNFRECICTDKDHRSYAQPQLFHKLAHNFCDSYAGDFKSLMCHHIPPANETSLYGDGAKWSRVFITCRK